MQSIQVINGVCRVNEPIVIIGGGVGGLSAAIHLQAAGRQVLVLEKNSNFGGKLGELHSGGYRWDTGPSVLTMRAVFNQLFHSAGRDPGEYFNLSLVEPLTRYFFPDGTVLDFSRDIEKTVAEIESSNLGDRDGYRAFLKYADGLFRVLLPIFIQSEPPSLRSLYQTSPLDPFRLDALRTMQQAIDRYVQSSHLRQILGRFATYVGASPFLAPATLNVITHVELNQGVWYPEGGMYRLSDALVKCASDLGVELRPRQAVEQILVEAGRVKGVRLHGGRQISANVIVSNVDARLLYGSLLDEDPGGKRFAQRIVRQESSSSGFLMLLGIKRSHTSLSHHNVLFSPDYRLEFNQIFQQGIPPTDPTIYVAITSKSTISDAPDGNENWFVMVNVPSIGPGWSWDENQKNYRDLVLQKLAERGYALGGYVEEEHIITPLDLERNTGSWGGALYGTSSNNRFAAFRRPHNRARYPQGLYLAGGTTHPGGGVPLSALSGGVASKMILSDLSEKH
jgi:phytoene desaturase